MAFLANLQMKKPLIIPHFLEAYHAKKLRVGFSGGADSTALLLLLLEWGFNAEQLEAVHFDHGLRGEASTADGEWCRDFCKARNIKFILVKLDLSKAISQSGSLEDAARNARLEWYKVHDDQSSIVLAHHAGDVAENMLLKLARSSNVSTLTSLRQERKLWNLTILRPLLHFQKAALEDFLIQHNVTDWRHDATNHESVYHRNFLRNEVLKKWQAHHAPVTDGLAGSAKVLAMDADFIEQAAAGKLAELGEILPEKTSVNYWQGMHEALLGRVLRSYLAEMANDCNTALSQNNIERFKQVLALPESSEKRLIELNKDFRFLLTGKTLELLSDNISSQELLPQIWDYRKNPVISYGMWQIECNLLPGAVSHDLKGVFYFDAGLMPGKLRCTFRKGGETMQVWGNKEPRRVKHLLCGTENKENMLLITDSNEQIYLLGDLRRSIHAPVTEKTITTLEIKVCKSNQ